MYNSHIKLSNSTQIIFKISTSKAFNKDIKQNINSIKNSQNDYKQKLTQFQDNVQHIIQSFYTEKQNNEKLRALVSTTIKEIKVIKKTYDNQLHYLETKTDSIESLLKEYKSAIQKTHKKEKQYLQEKNDMQNEIQLLKNQFQDSAKQIQENQNTFKAQQQDIESFSNNLQQQYPQLFQAKKQLIETLTKKSIFLQKQTVSDQQKNYIIELLILSDYLLIHQKIDTLTKNQIADLKQNYLDITDHQKPAANIHSQNQNNTNQNKENHNNMLNLKDKFFIEQKVPEIIQDV